MLRVLLVFAPSSNFYTFSTVLFHKYGGANVVVTKYMSNLSMLVLTKADVMETRYMPKELGLFFFLLLTDPLYIQEDQFIIFHIKFTTTSHWVLSNIILVFKRLHLNLLNIVILLTLKVVLRDHPTSLGTI